MLLGFVFATAISSLANGNECTPFHAPIIAPRDLICVGMTRKEVEKLVGEDELFGSNGKLVINKGSYHVYYSRIRVDVVYLENKVGGADTVFSIKRR